MYGYEPGGMDGLPTAALYADPGDEVKAQFSYAQLARGQTARRVEPRKRKDGSVFWTRADGRAVDPQEPLKGSVWIVEDITEQRHAEDELQRVLAQQQALLNNVVVGIQFTRERKTVRCNRRFEELFGYAAGAAVGASTRDFYFTDEEWEKAGTYGYDEINLGRTHTREQWARRQDGSGFWCRISGRAVEAGDPSKGYVWLLEDISERKRADEALERALAEQELILDNATVGIAFVGDRAIRRCNRYLEEMVGAGPGELDGVSTQQLFASEADWHEAGERSAGVAPGGTFVGDARLKEISQRLVNQLRVGDTICRIGGDEFVVVLPEVKRASDVAQVAQKVIEQLSLPVPIEGRELIVTASIGIAVYPEDGADAETLIRNADAAMYHAKELGRANYQFFTDQMNQAASHRVALESELRRALGRGELRVHYQA